MWSSTDYPNNTLTTDLDPGNHEKQSNALNDPKLLHKITSNFYTLAEDE